MKFAPFSLTAAVSVIMFTASPHAQAMEAQSKFIQQQTESCLSSASSNADKADCYIDGFTSAVMATKTTSEALTEKFPADFAPWNQSIDLWRNYTNNEDLVINQVFADGKNARLTVGGAQATYLLGMSRLRLLETYQAEFSK